MTALVGWVPPGLPVGALLVLVLTQLFYAAWLDPRRRYLAVLLLTAGGVVLGQLWDVLGLPAIRMGTVNLLPAVPFAAALQTLAGRLTLRLP